MMDFGLPDQSYGPGTPNPSFKIYNSSFLQFPTFWRQRPLVSVGTGIFALLAEVALLAQASACAALVGSVRFQPSG
jgi:hypothetical protein